jgi:hypothetical protein
VSGSSKQIGYNIVTNPGNEGQKVGKYTDRGLTLYASKDVVIKILILWPTGYWNGIDLAVGVKIRGAVALCPGISGALICMRLVMMGGYLLGVCEEWKCWEGV